MVRRNARSGWNNNNNNNNDNNNNSKKVSLLPKKKRDVFLSHQRPPQSILSLVLSLLKPSRVLQAARGIDDMMQTHKRRQVSCDVSVHRTSVFCSGRYIKNQRGLSQTPWILNGKVMGDGSVEEFIAPHICGTMRGDSYSFISSGREDIDVRMLGNGRPFAVEIKNPKKFLSLAPTISDQGDCQLAQRQRQRALLNAKVEASINANAANDGKVQVRGLQFFCSTEELNIIKAAGEGKQKCYRALIWSSCKFTMHDYKHIKSLKNIKVFQNTPIRVLHRRSPLIREKIIHEMELEPVSDNWIDSHYAVINMRTSAGTYIKEFVHGDIGRTKPSLATFLGNNDDGNEGVKKEATPISVQILQLDVSDVIV